jgi:hypothetical protein
MPGGRADVSAVLCSTDRLEPRTPPVPILIFLILVLLIAQVGFWKTFAAIIGGIAMVILFIVLAVALIVLAGILLTRRMR